MENEKNIFASLTKWFAKSCDGDWEHENQIKIQTTSNPGWLIEIDILQTEYKQLEIDKTMHVNENNWYFSLYKKWKNNCNRRYKQAANTNRGDKRDI